MKSLKVLNVMMVAAAMMMGYASGAQATTYNLGTNYNLGTLADGSVTNLNGNHLGSLTGAQFTDTYTFGVGSTSDAITFSSYASVGSITNITNFLVGLYNSNNLNSALVSASGQGASFDYSPLTTIGSYTLKISGIGSGTQGGNYGGGLIIASVPEPETWAMMLIGVGLVGFQLRRKSAQNASQDLV